jgi:hypothetical protein
MNRKLCCQCITLVELHENLLTLTLYYCCCCGVLLLLLHSAGC